MQTQEQAVRSYLLGALSELEQTRIEKHFFRDPFYLEQVLALEIELIEDYVTDRLSAEERALFERRYRRSPTLRRRVALAEDLSALAARRQRLNSRLRSASTKPPTA